MKPTMILLLCTALLATACATLTPQERAGVRMTRDNNLVRDCQWLGQIETSWQLNQKRAGIRLMKKTFALGGNVVLIAAPLPSPTGRLTGDAYRCVSLPGQ